MKKLSLLLAALLLIAYSTAWSKTMKPVIITGNIINRTEKTPKVIKFNFSNPVIDESRSVETKGAEQFRTQQDMLYTQNMTVNYSGYFINLYVKPGDSVNLNIDASLLDKPNFEWVTITGNGAKIKTQLNLCAHYIYKLFKTPDYNMQLPPDAMLAMVKQDYNKYVLAIDKYAAENNLDEIIINWAKTDIKYVIANMIIGYGNDKNLTLNEKQQRLEIFKDPFFDIYNADNFQSMYFPYHLQAYAGKSVRFYQDINEKTSPEELLKKTLLQLTKLPIGEYRDYILYWQLTTIIKKYPTLKTSLNNAGKYFSTETYAKQFQKIIMEGNKQAFPDLKIAGVKYLDQNAQTTSLPRTNIADYLAAKYPGKVVYIDVYATWCGPCLEEMESTPAIYAAMKNKDVVFVNLCLESVEANWKKLVKDRSIEGENYFFTTDASRLFMSNYQLRGFSAYVLMNKKGEIVNTSAPRPSEKDRLVSAIDELLMK